MGDGNGLGTSLSFRGKLITPSNNPFYIERDWGMGAVLVGHECIVFGGHRGGETKHRVYKYDIVKNKWLAVLPNNESDSFGSVRATFIVDDLLYAFVWLNRYQNYAFMSLDLISMEEWVHAGKGPCVQPGFGTAGSYVEARNELVLYGGEDDTDISVYSLRRSSWHSPEASGNPPPTRYNHSTCCTGRNMFVIGGVTSGQQDSVLLDLYVLSMHRERFSWSTPVTSGGSPTKRHTFTATYAFGRIFVYGGFDGLTCFDVYSVKQNRWYIGTSRMTNNEEGKVHFTSELPEGNAFHAAVISSSKLLVFGGSTLSSKTPLEIAPV